MGGMNGITASIQHIHTVKESLNMLRKYQHTTGKQHIFVLQTRIYITLQQLTKIQGHYIKYIWSMKLATTERGCIGSYKYEDLNIQGKICLTVQDSTETKCIHTHKFAYLLPQHFQNYNLLILLKILNYNFNTAEMFSLY